MKVNHQNTLRITVTDICQSLAFNKSKIIYSSISNIGAIIIKTTCKGKEILIYFLPYHIFVHGFDPRISKKETFAISLHSSLKLFHISNQLVTQQKTNNCIF